MISKTKHYIIITIWILLLALTAGNLAAAGDVQVSFRFYEGLKNKDIPKETVISSYSLRPLLVGNLYTRTPMAKESEELRRIFNLEGLKLLNRTQWGWKEGDTSEAGYTLVINDHEFRVAIKRAKAADTFRVEVFEKTPKGDKELLGTEIVLPESKTAVFGFEDTANKSYFISFHREQDSDFILEDAHRAGDFRRPRLVKSTVPTYPAAALKMRVGGEVFIEATTDPQGKVVNARVLSGPALLRSACIKAIKKWKYEPFMVDGKPAPVTFTVKLMFNPRGFAQSKKSIERKYVGDPMDIHLKNATIDKTAQYFQRISGVPVKVEPGIKALVTCDFTQTPWDQALETILKLNGLIMYQGKEEIVISYNPGITPPGASGSKKKKGKHKDHIDVYIANAPLPDVFRKLGRGAGYDVRVETGIEGAMSCNMKRVLPLQAIEMILRGNRLYMVKEGEKLIIRKIRAGTGGSPSVPDIWPTRGYLTSGFGKRIHPITGKKEFHNGLDIAARTGTDIIAAAGGEVIHSAFKMPRGNTVIIDHRNGYSTVYSQMQKFLVKKGDRVKKGDLIGYVGSSGRSTGPHLHWEVHLNGKPVDPSTVVKEK